MLSFPEMGSLPPSLEVIYEENSTLHNQFKITNIFLIFLIMVIRFLSQTVLENVAQSYPQGVWIIWG